MAPTTRASFRSEVGHQLRRLRLAAGITSQEKLAELAGVHRTYIGRLERGESGVTIEALAMILSAMRISLADFFRPFHTPVRIRTPRKKS